MYVYYTVDEQMNDNNIMMCSKRNTILYGTSLFLYRAKIGRNEHEIVVYFFVLGK